MKKNARQSFRKLAAIFAVFALSFGCVNGLYAQEAEEAPVESGLPTDEAVIKAGESLFKSSCKSCHAMDKVLVGPALQGVTERRELPWLKSWIENAPKMIKDGDPIAVELYEEYKSEMTSFKGLLSEDEITSILAYIQVWQPEVAVGPIPPIGGDGVVAQQDDTTLILVLTIVLVLLVVVVVVLVLMSVILSKTLNQRDDLDEADIEQINQKHSVIKVLTHPAFIGVVVVVTLLVGFLLGVKKGLYEIGVQQGYAPTQPIPFSHKLHAGEHEIDCNYCHTGVRKAKHANIPSPNICMNCHSEIKLGSEKLQKLYEAVDFDPETKSYGPNKMNAKPIQWVRIHNLPDLAYFNHAQHVKVGGIECETCHGEIKEMEVVRQYSPLTMGWCIDCHRKTEVNAKDNAYYDKLLELHEDNSKEPMTVEDIGGLECSKCHY